MSKKVTLASIKKLGWDEFVVRNDSFQGAVINFENDKGQLIAVGFNHEEAFVLEDDAGLFKSNELAYNMKGKALNFHDTSNIVGLTPIAWLHMEGDEFITSEVDYDEEKLEKLGLNDFSVKEKIKERIQALYSLIANQIEARMG